MSEQHDTWHARLSGAGDRELLEALAGCVDDVLENDLPNRVACLMRVEQAALARLGRGSSGWGSELAARGWPHVPEGQQ